MLKRFIIGLLSLSVFSSSFAASQWDIAKPADADSPSTIGTNIRINNDALDRLLSNYRKGCELTYASAATLSVSAGEITLSNSDGSVRWVWSVRRFRSNTSSTTVGWADIDEGAEDNDTYYVYAVADTDATTFTCKISLDDSAPTGATYYRRLGSFVNATDIGSVIDDDSNYFGTRASLSSGTIYQATTDGFVYGYRSATSSFTVYSDSSSNPTTLRAAGYVGESEAGYAGSFCVPVCKGEYYKVTGATGAWWIPIGN